MRRKGKTMKLERRELNCTVNLYGGEIKEFDKIKKHMEKNRDCMVVTDNDVIERLVAIGMLYYEQHEKESEGNEELRK